MTTWSRLYVDYFHTVHDVQFTDFEWSTFRCWTFAQKTGHFSDKLNADSLSNSNPLQHRLYHLVLCNDFYLAAFASTFEGSEEANTSATSNAGLLTSGLSMAAGTSEPATPPPPLKVITFPPLGCFTGEKVYTLTDEVLASQHGEKFHLASDRQGLRNATSLIEVVELGEAKNSKKTLCTYCEDNPNFQLTECATLGCTFKPTFLQYF